MGETGIRLKGVCRLEDLHGGLSPERHGAGDVAVYLSSSRRFGEGSDHRGSLILTNSFALQIDSPGLGITWE